MFHSFLYVYQRVHPFTPMDSFMSYETRKLITMKPTRSLVTNLANKLWHTLMKSQWRTVSMDKLSWLNPSWIWTSLLTAQNENPWLNWWLTYPSEKSWSESQLGWLFHIIFTLFHIYAHYSTYFHIIPHIFTLFHIYSHYSTYIHIIPHIFTLFHIYSHYSTYIHIIPHISTLFHIYSHYSTYFHIYYMQKETCSKPPTRSLVNPLPQVATPNIRPA